MDHGHLRAREYPIGMVWEEVRIVVDRMRSDNAMRAILMRAAISATKTEDAASAFDKMIGELLDGKP